MFSPRILLWMASSFLDMKSVESKLYCAVINGLFIQNDIIRCCNVKHIWNQFGVWENNCVHINVWGRFIPDPFTVIDSNMYANNLMYVPFNGWIYWRRSLIYCYFLHWAEFVSWTAELTPPNSHISCLIPFGFNLYITYITTFSWTGEVNRHVVSPGGQICDQCGNLWEFDMPLAMFPHLQHLSFFRYSVEGLCYRL